MMQLSQKSLYMEGIERVLSQINTRIAVLLVWIGVKVVNVIMLFDIK